MKKLKKMAIIAAFTMGLTLLPSSLFADSPSYTRLAGNNRIETALEVCEAGWDSADTVILAPADGVNLVDSLAAAPLAGQEDAPILVTFKASLDPAVKTKIIELKAKKVYVIGAISDKVMNEVDAISEVSAVKLSGSDRIATARAITNELEDPAGTFVVGYQGLADALSVSAYAAAHNFAISLANFDGSISQSDLVGETHFIVGGTNKVDDIVGAKRFSGNDDFATNLAVAEGLYNNLDHLYIANGITLVDALAVAPLAAKNGDSFVLLSSTTKTNSLKNISDETKVFAVGGAAVVPDTIVNKAISGIANAEPSVKAENLLQLSLNLKGIDYNNMAIDVLDNYKFKGILNDEKEEIKIVDVEETNSTLLLTLEEEVDNQSVGSLVIDEDITGKELSFDVEFVDREIPTIEKIEVVGKSTVKMFFSEPIVNLSEMEDEFELSTDKEEYFIDEIASLKNGREANVKFYGEFDEETLTITINNGLEDYAGFNVLKDSYNVKVKKDTVAPRIVGYKNATQHQVTLIFNEEIQIQDEDRENFYHSNRTNTIYSDIDYEKDIKGKELTLDFAKNRLPEGIAYIYISPGSISDFWGNNNEAIKQEIEIEKDGILPIIKEVEFDSDKNAIIVLYSEDLDQDSAEDKDNYIFVDEDGNFVRFGRIEFDDNKVTLYLRNEDPSEGVYDLTIQDVEDLAGNEIKKSTIKVTIVDSVPPLFPEKIYFEEGKSAYTLFVEYSEEMADTGAYSIKDLSNYEIFDASIQKNVNLGSAKRNGDLDIEIAITNNARGVKITVDGFELDPDKDYLQIARVADKQGNYSEGFGSDKLEFVSMREKTIKLTHQGAVATARNTIEVEFDVPLQSIDVDDFYFAIDGKKKDIQITGLKNKDNKVIFTIDKNRLLPGDLKEGDKPFSIGTRGGIGDTDYKIRSKSSRGAMLEGGQVVTIIDQIAPDVDIENNKDTSVPYEVGENGARDGILTSYGTYYRDKDLTFVTVKLSEPVRKIEEDIISVNDEDYEVLDVLQDGTKGILEFVVEGQLYKGDQIEISIVRDYAGNYNTELSLEIEYEVEVER